MPSKSPLLSLAPLALLLAACSPTVQLQAPDRPIEIKVEMEVQQLFDSNKGLF